MRLCKRPPPKGDPRRLVLRRRPGRPAQGLLAFAGQVHPCAIGRSGLSARKREGDGATPIGRWVLRRALYRGDRRPRPRAALPVRAIAAADGWCDAAGDRNYNRPVRHPYRANAERLWRADALYDLLVVLGYNDVSRSQGRGSAIFMHLAHPGYRPTQGCVALARRPLERLLASAKRKAALTVLP